MSVSTKRHRGFSLLELMVVIAIITVMMTYALPNVLGTRKTEQLKSATDDVIDVFHYAKVRAATAFVAYGVEFEDTDGGRFRVVPGAGPDCGSINFADPEVKDLHFQAPADVGGNWNVTQEKNVEVEQILPAGLTEVCFTPDGRFVKKSDSQPVPATLEANNYAAGEFIITLSRFDGGNASGIKHHIIVSYSGRARFTFGTAHTDNLGEGY